MSTDRQTHLEILIAQCSDDFVRRRKVSDIGVDKPKCSDRFLVVILLVYFITRCNNLQNISIKESYSWDDIISHLVPARSAVDISNLFLSYMLEKDGFIQDMATYGLCHVYVYCSNMAQLEPTRSRSEGVDVFYSEALKAIASNTIAFLSKERRGLAPVGFGVAGTTASGVMSSPTLVGADGILTSLVASAPPAIAEAVRQMSTVDRDASDQSNRQDRLDGRQSTQNSGQSPNQLASVHAEVCKIAKKSGDSTSVFAFLSMVRCDPSFGVGLSAIVSQRYRPPMVSIPEEKIPGIIPLMYQLR